MTDIIHYARSLCPGGGFFAPCDNFPFPGCNWTTYWPDVNCPACLAHMPEEERQRREKEWERLAT